MENDAKNQDIIDEMAENNAAEATDAAAEISVVSDTVLTENGVYTYKTDIKTADFDIDRDLMNDFSREDIGATTSRAEYLKGTANVFKSLLAKLKESATAVLPVAVIIAALSFTPLVKVTDRECVIFIVSAALLVFGIAFFNLGADLAMTPMGEHAGGGLTKSKSVFILLSATFFMGLFITIAEPDLSVLAGQVSRIMDSGVLVATVGVGVGAFLLIGIAKIIYKKNLSTLLIFFYLVLFALVAVMVESGKAELTPLAFDSGGVTTGPITVPFVMALGLGVALNASGSGAKENSFGLIALASIGPMLAVAALSLFAKGDLGYSLPDYSFASDIGAGIKTVLASTAKDVSVALALITGSFLVLQFAMLKLPGKKLLQIGVGIIYTFVGLLIFFTAVHIGFMPIGYKIGGSLAAVGKPALIIFGFVIGCVVVLAEPAIHVLIKQVEQVTDGSISKRSMLIALSVGVGISIGLSVIREIYGFSLLYYLVPGYILSLGLTFFVPRLYTAVAFDSGGVASGPLTASFILPMMIGACTQLNGEGKVLSLAFGVVAMVAMTPLITIQLLGFRAIMTARVKDKITMRRIVGADDEQIIEFM